MILGSVDRGGIKTTNGGRGGIVSGDKARPGPDRFEFAGRAGTDLIVGESG